MTGCGSSAGRLTGTEGTDRGTRDDASTLLVELSPKEGYSRGLASTGLVSGYALSDISLSSIIHMIEL